MSEQLTDWRGTPIAPGAVVLYATRAGSSTYTTEARVLDILEGERPLRVQPIREKGSYGSIDAKEGDRPRRVGLTHLTVLRPAGAPDDAELLELRRDALYCQALRDAGVGNWGGYDHARDELREILKEDGLADD